MVKYKYILQQVEQTSFKLIKRPERTYSISFHILMMIQINKLKRSYIFSFTTRILHIVVYHVIKRQDTIQIQFMSQKKVVVMLQICIQYIREL